jgi:DNA-binding LacI/PurR family transcriptional regulator
VHKGRRITLLDIARAAKVDKSTVSLALRDDPRVRPESKATIIGIAQKLGYRPDARLSHLMSYLRNVEVTQKNEPIAYLRFESRADHAMDKIPFFWEFHQGAVSEMKKLGYEITEFFVEEYGFKYARLSQVLYHRGIKGILVSPPSRLENIEGFEWEHFAAITMGYRLRSPFLHRVVCDQIVIIRMVFEKLVEMGYTRPLLAHRHGRDEHVNRRWSIAFNGVLGHFPAIAKATIYSGDPDDAFVRVLRDSRADCVVGLSYAFAQAMTDAGIAVPAQCGFMLLDRHDGPINVTSIDQQPFYLGQVAGRQLAGFLDRNEFGVPDNPFTLAIRPRWIDGKTALPRKAGAADSASRKS